MNTTEAIGRALAFGLIAEIEYTLGVKGPIDMADHDIGDAVFHDATSQALNGIFRASGYDAGIPVAASGIQVEQHSAPGYSYGHIHYSRGHVTYLSDLLGYPTPTAELVNAIAVDTDGTLAFRGTDGKRYYINPASVKDVTGTETLTILQYAIYGGALREVGIQADVSYVYQQVAEARRRKCDDL